jgi:putative transposase
MAFVKIWVHVVFSTKNRARFLSPDIKKELITHIFENCKTKGIFPVAINGMSDHLHCLISLGRDQNIANVVKLIKGESSHWLNQEDRTHAKFEWGDEYFAVSIGESQVDTVKKYIANQEEHHSRKTFSAEHAQLMSRYGFDKLD